MHPEELRRRRRGCRSLVQRLESAPRAPVTACNACGGTEKALLAPRDRYGVDVRTAMCLRCGLVYLLEPLTAAAYADFYASGTYRELTGRFSRRRRSLTQVRAGQASYAARVGEALEPFLVATPGARLLDIGASTGLVASRFRRRFGFHATLLDPAAGEIRQRETRDMELVESSFEDWRGDGPYDLILLCRTVEHLLDLRGSLARIRDLLAPEGRFYCDVADFFEICRREGPAEAVSRLDHLYWLSQETARVFFRRLGLRPLAVVASAPYDQVGFVLGRAEADPEACLPPGWIDARMRRLREIGDDWLASGRRARDPADWLRRRASRVKRLLRR